LLNLPILLPLAVSSRDVPWPVSMADSPSDGWKERLALCRAIVIMVAA
jgi:hypothetical protein